MTMRNQPWLGPKP